MHLKTKLHWLPTLKQWLKWIIIRKEVLLFWLLLLGIYITNTYHTNFSDEYDNIVGGWYINRGILPYTGFFSHHNPGAYYIASLIAMFTNQSFVSFRIVWAVVLFVAVFLTTWFWHQRFKKEPLWFFLSFWFIWGVTATYYWGHMLLSETVVAYALIPGYVLVLIKYLRNIPITLIDIFFISILTALALLTSFSF